MNREWFLRELLGIFIGLPSYKENAGACPLVGGQSLFLWMMYYQDRIADPEGRLFTAAESTDIDFLTNKEVAEELAEAFPVALGKREDLISHIEKVEVHKAGAFSSTPSLFALLIYLKEDPDLPVVIDLLSDIKGLSRKELDNYSVQDLSVGCATLLTPSQVLKSRLANLYGLSYSDKRKENEVIRVKIASLVVAEYIRDLADAGNEKRARDMYQDLYAIGMQSEGIRIFTEKGIDITEPLPDPKAIGLADAFCERQLPKLKERLNKKREGAFNRIKNLTRVDSEPSSAAGAFFKP